MPPPAPQRSCRSTRRYATLFAALAAALIAAACAAEQGDGTASQPQSPSGVESEPQPTVPTQAGPASGQSTAGDRSGGDGQFEPSPAGQDGAGTGGEITGAAPGNAGSGASSDGTPGHDGDGTPPAGSGDATSTNGSDDAGAASAPPITPGGPRFPEPVGLTLTRLAELPVPLALAFRAQEPEALYVALRHGEVVRLRGEGARADAAALLHRGAEAVLDMSARVDTRGEMGLLGLSFSPAGDRLYTSSVNRRQVSELWEWPVAPDGSVDAGGGRLVLSLEQPFWNHNGGDVTFGPDGYLYLGFGDGGGAGDPLRAGQDPHDWLGTILRIDPRRGPAGEPYTVPAGNPFADGADGAPEVWVWGARNPWRFSFDRLGGDLWVSDVGQDLLEEINRLPAADGGAGRGANLGWSDYEGSAPFWSNTEPPGHIRPVVEYRHGADARCSVTGGYVYRGSRLPGLGGVYLYSDFCDGTLWGYSEVAGAHPLPLAAGAPPEGVLSFGQGPDGEIYVLTPDALWRLERT